ncbi:MAG TPA: FHA domain-containing protein [Longimicrobiaceae bacterium]|nr:FHA domain-containing protein [Longimicrobiaceae bacterium]
MQAVLQGNLDRFPLSQVLLFLGGNGHSGTLDLDLGDRRTRLFLERGTIVGAETAHQRDAGEAVLDALGRRNGTFAFLDGVAIPDSLTRVSLDVDWLLAEAERRAAAAYGDAVLLRVIDDPAAHGKITLSPDQFKLLLRIGGGKSFGALVADSGGAREQVSAALKELEAAGLVAAVSEEGGTPRRKTRKTLVGSLTAGDGDIHPLIEAQYTIGREAANEIAIKDASVSSRHARLTRTADGFLLEDLESRNGTFVNGERLTGKRVLANGDVVRFGKVILTFQLADEPADAGKTRSAPRVP